MKIFSGSSNPKLAKKIAKNLGVNTDELLLSQPDNGEQALEICEILLKSGALVVML